MKYKSKVFKILIQRLKLHVIIIVPIIIIYNFREFTGNCQQGNVIIRQKIRLLVILYYKNLVQAQKAKSSNIK